MKNKRFKIVSLVLASAGCAFAQSSTRPNILIVVADDHRQDLIGKYHAIIQTPTLDDLCNNGVYFKNAYVTTPICAASRASIFTGLTERTHGYTFGQSAVPAEFAATAYPKVLKENGYRTGFVGKYGCSLSGAQSERFDMIDSRGQTATATYNGVEMHHGYYMANVAGDFIEDCTTNHPGTPWCMSVSFWNPHAFDGDLENQYYYPEEFESLYEDVTIPEARISSDADFNALPDFIRSSMSRTRWGWRYDTPEKFQKMVKRYYRAIAGVDKAVQMIRDRLDALGVAGNTVIIYIGDNGYMINERQLAGKWLGWEECLRVPLIVYDPRSNALHGVELDQAALNIDLAPTMVEMAGIDIPEMYQGRSLYPLLKGDTPLWRHEFFFEHYFIAGGSIPRNEGVRTERWKYVNFTLDAHEQLYDLHADPGETNNLATHAAYAAELELMRNAAGAYGELYSDWPYAESVPEPTDREVYVDNEDSAVVYSGTWNRQSNSGDYNGSMHWANDADDSAECSFEGQSIKVGVRKGNFGGLCDIYVDGELVAEDVDTHGSASQAVVYEAALSNGIHTVKLVATGNKSSSSAGANIMFDFLVYTTSEQQPPQLPTDTDSDGLPDVWEVRYLETLSKNAGEDDDRDGLSNQDEYVAGTHPKNAGSVFKIQRFAEDSSGEGYLLSWDSVAGRTYRVLESVDLASSVWQVVFSNLTGSGEELAYRSPEGAPTNRFYKIQVAK
ncbi:sulfatase-like hydrolase/transferase [Pontiella sp.]|uniref:sulfatase-like hydrolase/transferase n=1 Tax=Pontiella sp. TaxID=2837462 RepID=UPI00356215C5